MQSFVIQLILKDWKYMDELFNPWFTWHHCYLNQIKNKYYKNKLCKLHYRNFNIFMFCD